MVLIIFIKVRVVGVAPPTKVLTYTKIVNFLILPKKRKCVHFLNSKQLIYILKILFKLF